MNLSLDFLIASEYKNKSQIARVVTENWAEKNMYCPVCGNDHLCHYRANKPVADFYCAKCASDFELKSKQSLRNIDVASSKIVAGAYVTTIERITSKNNPHLLYMVYNEITVTNILFIPQFFFVPEIIEKRSPLKETARRAGWTGCNIRLDKVPNTGKLPVVTNNYVEDLNAVLSQYEKIRLLQTNDIAARGWLLDVLLCVEKLGTTFGLDDLYAFEHELAKKHPRNNHVRPKIRQQLQLLRDTGTIEFIERGKYKKT